MKWLILILLAFVIAVSGCTQQCSEILKESIGSEETFMFYNYDPNIFNSTNVTEIVIEDVSIPLNECEACEVAKSVFSQCSCSNPLLIIKDFDDEAGRQVPTRKWNIYCGATGTGAATCADCGGPRVDINEEKKEIRIQWWLA